MRVFLARGGRDEAAPHMAPGDRLLAPVPSRLIEVDAAGEVHVVRALPAPITLGMLGGARVVWHDRGGVCDAPCPAGENKEAPMPDIRTDPAVDRIVK